MSLHFSLNMHTLDGFASCCCCFFFAGFFFFQQYKSGAWLMHHWIKRANNVATQHWFFFVFNHKLCPMRCKCVCLRSLYIFSNFLFGVIFFFWLIAWHVIDIRRDFLSLCHWFSFFAFYLFLYVIFDIKVVCFWPSHTSLCKKLHGIVNSFNKTVCSFYIINNRKWIDIDAEMSVIQERFTSHKNWLW